MNVEMMRAPRRRVLLSWLLLLIALLTWWLTAMSWPPRMVQILAGLLILPLVLFLPAVLGGSRYATAASTLLLIPYLGWGLTEVVANPGARIFASLTVLSASVCFVFVIAWLRLLRSA